MKLFLLFCLMSAALPLVTCSDCDLVQLTLWSVPSWPVPNPRNATWCCDAHDLDGTINIRCDATGHVLKFTLRNAGLTGPVPLSVGLFTMINRLDLALNQLHDLTPISNLVTLEYLDLGNNRFASPSPFVDLSGLILLNYIDLQSNQFIGSTLQGLSALTALQQFNIKYNSFSGVLELFLISSQTVEICPFFAQLFLGILSPNNFSLSPFYSV